MTYSLTKIKTFFQCQFKYKLRYIERLKEPQNEYAARGTETHSALERFILNGDRLPPNLEFYHGFLTQLKQHPTPLHVESRIALRSDWTPAPDTEEPHLLAYFDLERYVESNCNIWDWKTGKIYPDHDDQKELYSLMHMANRPETMVVTFTHVYTDLGKNREKIFSREFDYEQGRKKWNDKIATIEATPVANLSPNPQFLCRYCGYSRAKGGPCQF